MANQKVTQLPFASVSNDSDFLYVVQSNTSKKMTKQMLMSSTLAAANAAQSDATTAISNAATANSAATAAQTDATQAIADALAAQTDATQAITDAAAASSTANAAQSTATAAQSTASQGVSDAAAAQSTANAAQSDATQAISDAAAATSTANAASSTATAAQSTATTANSAAAAAQSTATQGVTDAAAAQSTANSATSTANAAQSTANAALPKAGGTMTGGINMGSQSLTSLAAPNNATDAATKGYVDTGVSSANSAASAAQSTANTAVQDAAAAQTTANAALPKAGGTMTGALNMGSQGLTNLTTPSASTDAATKGYVDTGLGGKQNTTATTTGVAIALVTPQEYGSYGTPQTGNITVSLTSAVRGVDQILYHDDSVAPSITVTGGTAIKFGTASYDLTKVNVIAFWFMGGTNVGYIITPAV